MAHSANAKESFMASWNDKLIGFVPWVGLFHRSQVTGLASNRYRGYRTASGVRTKNMIPRESRLKFTRSQVGSSVMISQPTKRKLSVTPVYHGFRHSTKLLDISKAFS